MEKASRVRNHKEVLIEQYDDEQVETVTSREQKSVESLVQLCYERFEQISCFDHYLPVLRRKEHLGYLEKSIGALSSSYECLDSSRPWLVYWILNATSILNYRFPKNVQSQIVGFLKRCQNPTGGFGGGPGQHSHLATTYAAVNSLCILGTPEAYEAIDRANLMKFLQTLREPTGAFKMHFDGEVDVRGAYCALSAAKLSALPAAEVEELFKDTPKWIKSCQTYEGGFGGAPGLEAHGGYSFCAVAALFLLNTTGGVNTKSLLRWVVNRQMRYEGGFQGRTNKLVDGCYSFWQGALMPLVQGLISLEDVNEDIRQHSRAMFDSEPLQEYILICCQRPEGGLIDKPGKPVDLYHTCYCLSGLSVAQHYEHTLHPRIIGRSDNEVIPTHPIYNIPPKAVVQAGAYFNSSASVASSSNSPTGERDDEDLDSSADATSNCTTSDIWNGRED